MPFREEYTPRSKQENPLPADFSFEELTPSNDHGGSSRLYFLGEEAVVKESQENFPDREALADKVRRLQNNLDICIKYLGSSFLEARVIAKIDPSGKERIYFIQRRAPKNAKTLNPEAWNFITNEEGRADIAGFIEKVEKMYSESGLMIDLLALANLFYDELSGKILAIDGDPLICAEEIENELSKDFIADARIDAGFKTYNHTETTNALEANLEHLELLRTLLTSHF
jgi:hypothetical protein